VDYHHHNVSGEKADMVTNLGQAASDLSSTGNRPNASAVENVMCAAVDSTLAATHLLASGGTVCMAAGSTLAATPLALGSTVCKASTLSIMLVNTAPKISMTKCKKKDDLVEIEDSFLTYMETGDIRKTDE